MWSGDIFAGSAAIGAALVVYMHPTSTTSSAYQRRRTHHIKRRSASSIHHAPALAEAQGTPLTHFVTINFSEAGVAPERASEVFAKLRDDKFSPWVRRPPRNSGHAKTRPTFAWVLENGGNVIAAHWLVHLPEGRVTDFSARLPVWLGGCYWGRRPCRGARDPHASRLSAEGSPQIHVEGHRAGHCTVLWHPPEGPGGRGRQKGWRQPEPRPLHQAAPARRGPLSDRQTASPIAGHLSGPPPPLPHKGL